MAEDIVQACLVLEDSKKEQFLLTAGMQSGL